MIQSLSFKLRQGCFFLICLLAASCNSNDGATPQSPTPTPTQTSTSTPTFAFSPSSGAVGTIITLTGLDFSSAQSISVGGQAAILLSASTSALTAFVMPGTTTGAVALSMGGQNLTSQTSFMISSVAVPSNQQGSKITASDGIGANQQQGEAVAVSSDGNTAAIGGWYDNSAVGAVWIYTRSNGVWTEQTKLVGTGAVGAANQGGQVALSADGNTLIEGGASDNNSLGAVWVFTRSNGVWSQQGQKLVGTGSTASSNIYQGGALAISADGNTTAFSGSGDNSGVGAVWIFTRSAGVWTQQGSKIVPTGEIGAAGMGSALAISADGSTLAAGGPNDNSTLGATWIFIQSAGVWSQQTELVTANTATNAQQGYAVSLSADGNVALIGAPWADPSAGGIAWIFTRTGGTTWTQTQSLDPSDASTSEEFGYALSLSADGKTAAIGGPSDSGGAGALWFFTAANGTWAQQGMKLVGSGATGSASQASAVALSSDGSTVIFGGSADNSSASNSIGAAWVFGP